MIVVFALMMDRTYMVKSIKHAAIDVAERVVFGGFLRERVTKAVLSALYASRHRRRWRWQAYGLPHFTDQSIVLFGAYAGKLDQDIYCLTRGFLSGEAVSDGSLVLDIGCGDGGFTKRFLAPKALHVDALDIEPSAISYAKRYNSAANVEYRLLDAIRASFPRPTYDLIVFDGALGHISNDDADILFTKISGSLSPNGIFAGSETLGHLEGHDHLQFFETLEDLRAMLRKYFAVVSLKKVSYKINNGSFLRTEAYWRCCHEPKSLTSCGWSVTMGTKG